MIVLIYRHLLIPMISMVLVRINVYEKTVKLNVRIDNRSIYISNLDCYFRHR